MPEDIQWIEARDAHARLSLDPEALLVCAYDDPARFEQNRLEDALFLRDFEQRTASLPRDRDIIFYCA